jgi:hypothetical protein
VSKKRIDRAGVVREAIGRQVTESHLHVRVADEPPKIKCV